MAKKKNQLSADARALRNALYPPGDSLDFPSSERKEAVHQAILKLPGSSWYNSHRHLTWCSGREKTIRNANQKLAQSVVPAIENFLQTHLVHTPNPPFSVLQQWAAANGVGVSIIAGILDTMMPAPMTHSGPVHKGSTSSDMQETTSSIHTAAVGPSMPGASCSGLTFAEPIMWLPNTHAHGLDGHNTAFSNYNHKSELQANAYTSWSTPGGDSTDDQWSVGEGSPLPAYQHAPGAPYFRTGDE